MNKYSILILLLFFLNCDKKLKETKIVFSAPEKTTKSIVFIAGYDEGKNKYYKAATDYYKEQNIEVVDYLFSLQEIIMHLNQKNDVIYKKIHIVCHSNPWLGMSLKTTKTGARTTLETLSKAIEENQIPTLKHGISNATEIVFHSCGLGENEVLLQRLKQLFITDETPKLIASPFFNVFGGKYAGHYLAKPYYGYYPTAQSPGPIALSNNFKKEYPTINIDWYTALKTRKETNLGQVYSYKFNIPINWEFTFDDATEIPVLKNKETIMDWVSESPEMAEILYKLNIPIEKFRWKSKIVGNKLKIKGKTTVLCVLEPILQENDTSEYKTTNFNDTSLYQTL